MSSPSVVRFRPHRPGLYLPLPLAPALFCANATEQSRRVFVNGPRSSPSRAVRCGRETLV